MNKWLKVMAAGLVIQLVTMAAFAQIVPAAPPQNVVQLSADATVEVEQDWLMLSMNTTRDGTDAAQVQAQLKQALEAALQGVRPLAKPGQLDVRTGNFNLYPQRDRDGRITGWQGTVEMVLEGRDFALIGAAAGKVRTLTMAGVQLGLSREQRALAQDQAQGMAITRFKAQASDIAKGFGFAAYGLREIAVHANDQGNSPRPRMMAMQAKGVASDAAVPIEAGKTAVVVTVSGTVQLK